MALIQSLTNLLTDPKEETLVLLTSFSETQTIVGGVGGIPTGRLSCFDIKPKGATYLWGRAHELLVLLAGAITEGKVKNARIIGLDTSESMTQHQHILRRIWSSIPNLGIHCEDIELILVSDGQDNRSEGKFNGPKGINALIESGRQLGYSFRNPGDAPHPNERSKPLANIRILLLDVSPDKELSQTLVLEDGMGLSIVATTDVEAVTRVMYSRTSFPRTITSPSDFVAPTPDELAKVVQIEEVMARKINSKHRMLSLQDIINNRIADIPAPTNQEAYQYIKAFLVRLVNGEQLAVNRRGEHKDRLHTELNAVLYQLEKWSALQVTATSPRLWSRGIMWQTLADQLKEITMGTQEISLPSQFVTMVDGDTFKQKIATLARNDLEELAMFMFKRIKYSKNDD